MSLIVCILIGLCLGQFVKVTPDPALIDFFRRAWTIATEKAPLAAGFIAEKAGEAIDNVRMGPLQKAVKKEFAKIDSEIAANPSPKVQAELDRISRTYQAE